jgi:hypothetical protein
MKKSDRISAFVKELAPDNGANDTTLDPHYLGYFVCFNRGDYYEAHDVLENLWLQTPREPASDYAFYKGLIQIAGAFVHLRKQFERPTHPKDARRLRPASRLFDLGIANLSLFLPEHHCLDLERLIRFCANTRDAICESDFQNNPWTPHFLPQLSLETP